METIGFIGLGNLGSPMAQNVQKAGYPMVVHDSREGSAKPLLDGGARLASSPVEVARQCAVIFTSLPGPKEVEEVAIGAHGLLEGIQPDAVYVDLTTSRPALIRRIEPMFRQKGAHVLDAPVSATPATAAQNGVHMLPSGDRAVYDRIYPVLETFTKQVIYTGRLGNGSVCKLVSNMAAFTILQLIAESLTLGVKAGVELPLLMEAVGPGVVGERRTGTLARSLFGGTFDPPDFRLSLMRKDVGLATELGREVDVPLPMATFAEQLLVQAVNRGWGDTDIYAAMRLQEEAAGVELRSPDLAVPRES